MTLHLYTVQLTRSVRAHLRIAAPSPAEALIQALALTEDLPEGVTIAVDRIDDRHTFWQTAESAEEAAALAERLGEGAWWAVQHTVGDPEPVVYVTASAAQWCAVLEPGPFGGRER